MALERTFAMLKPGVLSRRLAGEILSRIERKGFDIVALKMIRISAELAGEHYAEHRNQDFFPSLVEYMTSGPVVAMVLEGDEAVHMLRRFCGPTRAEDAAPGTIRGDYAMHTVLNLIHASDSAEAAEREIARFFTPGEIVRWQDSNIRWI
jgi:nucleoside-diphosphate kinase